MTHILGSTVLLQCPLDSRLSRNDVWTMSASLERPSPSLWQEIVPQRLYVIPWSR